MASGERVDELGRVLREANEQELLRLLREHLVELDPPRALQVLRNPFAGREAIELILGRPVLLQAYEVRKALAVHPRTPEVQALRFVAGLFWRDLASIGADSRARPRVRRAADRHLSDRLAGLSVGEKMSIGRRCGPGVMARLRHDPSPRVMESLLENPRMTEGSLMPLLSSDTAQPEILACVARNQRWGRRYGIRVALCRNPRTPLDTGLALLPFLKKRDLGAVATDRRLARPLRRRAELLSGRAS